MVGFLLAGWNGTEHRESLRAAIPCALLWLVPRREGQGTQARTPRLAFPGRSAVVRFGKLPPREQRGGGRRRRPSQVEPKGPEVAGGRVVVVDGQGGDGDEELVAGLQLEQPALVESVEAVVCLGRPALGADPLEQEDGLAVGRLPVDALDELGDGDAGAGPVAGVAEIDLGVDVVLARLVDPQPAVPVGDVLQVGVDGAVFPAGNGVAAGLGEVPEALGVAWGEGRVTEGSEMLWGAPIRSGEREGVAGALSRFIQLGGVEKAVLGWTGETCPHLPPNASSRPGPCPLGDTFPLLPARKPAVPSGAPRLTALGQALRAEGEMCRGFAGRFGRNLPL